MDIRLFFKKLFNIPGKEYRDLYRQYSYAEKQMVDHISQIKPFHPISESVQHPVHCELSGNMTIHTYSPRVNSLNTPLITGHKSFINNMGLSEAQFDEYFFLCQRAETAYDTGDTETAKAISDSLDELFLPVKAKALRAYIKNVKLKIK